MRKVVLILLLMPLLGCVGSTRDIKVSRGYLARIATVKQPKLSELTSEELADVKTLKEATQKKLVGNVEALMLWGRKQQLSIEVYNNYVKMNNALVDRALGQKTAVEGKTDE